MRRQRAIRDCVVIGLILVGIVVLPSCRRAPEEPGPVAVVGTPGPDQMPYGAVLELPQQSPALGITLSTAPGRLVATFNQDNWLELTDETRPTLRFTFEADLPGSPSRSPAVVADFDQWLSKLTQGRLLDSGSLDTPFGPAAWASGEYFEEDESFSDVRIFAPHPSGNGTLILYSVGPAGVATIEERLDLMTELLTGVS